MKHFILIILIMVFLSSLLYAQKDTVDVQGYFESGGQYGTLNIAIDAARDAGTINNTVFRLTPYEAYVLSKSIYMGMGENLDIVAAKPLGAGDADPETVQAGRQGT